MVKLAKCPESLNPGPAHVSHCSWGLAGLAGHGLQETTDVRTLDVRFDSGETALVTRHCCGMTESLWLH